MDWSTERIDCVMSSDERLIDLLSKSEAIGESWAIHSVDLVLPDPSDTCTALPRQVVFSNFIIHSDSHYVYIW